jgi:membrane fusion protein (multidrug efflux system)
MKARSLLYLSLLSFFFLQCSKDEVASVESLPDITVVEVIQRDVPVNRDFVGEIYGFQDIPIRARVEGYLEGVHFEEGFPVKKGQLLYSIDPEPLEERVASMQSRVAEAQTYLVNAENELARYKPLAEINAVSKSDLDAAQASRDAAEAALEAANANLRFAKIELSYTKIYSPIDGLIGKTEAREGEFVGRDPNPVILNVVSQIDKVRVQFFLTESEYLAVYREFRASMDQDVKRKNNNIELILADGSLYEEKGDVEFLGRDIDTSTGSILIQALFPNSNGLLRPGMFAKVRVQFEVKEGAILAPQRCVTELQGQYSVYVVEEENTIKARTVKATERIGDLWLIEEGLQAGEKVVIDALQKVASGMKVNPVDTVFQSKAPVN